ncbi:MAG: hypothetical protein B0D92_03265 [Spirochaeta sp. LUC14_002_19_P3]|nr:MAG: hypothetical protein B0D92_03265 [Spirochaeta sp. LUC14_002_19_P3]
MYETNQSDEDFTEEKLLAADKLTALLESGGSLSRHLPEYEPRAGQIAMLKGVIESFNKARPLIAEAGTGIGKSLAYLLPALQWAIDNKKRVLISTATIALQQQIMDKDLPLARNLIHGEVKSALVKGRGNYLCLKRLAEASADEDMLDFDNEIERINVWAEGSVSGELSDLPFLPSGNIWPRVRCESDSCPGFYCPHYENCFFMRSRRIAGQAAVLVVNHHLLFADLAARAEGMGSEEAAVLPNYQAIVFDEAHHVEDAAVSMFSAVFSLNTLNRQFFRLHRGKPEKRDILSRILEYNPAIGEKLLSQIPPLISKARASAETADLLGRTVSKSPLRLSGEISDTEKEKIINPLEELREDLTTLIKVFTAAIEKLSELSELSEEEADGDFKGLILEAHQSADELEKISKLIKTFTERTSYPDEVFWLELFRTYDGSEQLHYHRTPLSVAPMLQEALWEQYERVLCVSATLALAGDFCFWCSRAGAAELHALEGIYESPFDFSSRVMLGIPADAPDPANRAAWEAFLIETTAAALNSTGGHALVLFTSYETLRTVIAGVRTALEEGAPLILAQGDDDRGRLLKQFRENTSSVLFATDSFWEGVDIPGEALQLLIITRLPFRPPTDPVAEARCEAAAAAGGHPFMDVTLPSAVTRFRQGFGRLMRRTTDYGAVLILDPRIVRKPYGRIFLQSLPPVHQAIKPAAGVIQNLKNFLEKF